jgi:hypothetical protein
MKKQCHYKIILLGENKIYDSIVEFETYDDFIFNLHMSRKTKDDIRIEIDPEKVTLDEYLGAVEVFFGISNIDIDPEIKTARDMQKWLDCFCLLSDMENKFI